MNKFIKLNSRFKYLVLTVTVIAGLAVFCYFVRFSLIIPLLLLFLGIHLSFLNKASIRLFLNLGLLLTLMALTTHSIVTYTRIPEYYLPVAAVAMLTVILFNDLQLGFTMSFITSTLAALIAGYDFNLMLIFFVGSLTAMFTVKDARTRGRLINAGLFIGLMQVLCSFLLNKEIVFLLPKEFLLNEVRPLFLNGFICAFATIATTKIFEWLFGVLTTFSLLELSDFNQPLLRRMILEAPGTYHHSLLVSNLAEAAAEAIGANSLLTRVGAYYHDIGKMVKPEYFTENQLNIANKHDDLDPNMSRLVILNHVKDGIEIGKKYKLHPIIIDFIPQHHGTGLIHYFYQKALEGAESGDVKEENFRYAGPKPQTKETALVMLADSVEGATRALEEPSPPKIDDVVRKIVNNRFIDGQLNECNLTLKEINIICSTYSRILSAMHHGRVKYPEKKDDNNHRKSPEGDTNKSRPLPQSRKKNP